MEKPTFKTPIPLRYDTDNDDIGIYRDYILFIDLSLYTTTPQRRKLLYH